MFDDLLLFLGLFGFVCSIGIRWTMRRDFRNRNSIRSDKPR